MKRIFIGVLRTRINNEMNMSYLSKTSAIPKHEIEIMVLEIPEKEEAE